MAHQLKVDPKIIRSTPAPMEWGSKSAKRKAKNLSINEARHQANVEEVKELGLASEEVTRTVQRVRKHGKKVQVDFITISKNKRPSKLLRKERRRDFRERTQVQIDRLAKKIGMDS